MPSIAFVAAHDSEFKWCHATSRRFEQAGWDVSFHTVMSDFKATPEQVRNSGLDFSALRILTMTEALQAWSTENAVVFVTNGDLCEKYLLALRQATSSSTTRPIMIAAYCGVVVTNHLAGYLARASADIVCANSPYDAALFSAAAAELKLPEKQILLTGLSILPEVIKPMRTGKIDTIIYADQAAIPPSPNDRFYIYQSLAEYARRHPERTVLVKPRFRPGETSYKKATYSPEEFFAQTRKIPTNLKITYEPIVHLLPKIDLLITISSTAALEAICEGCRVAIVADIGLKEAFGSPMFVGSGLLRTFAQISDDDLGSASREWLRQHEIERPGELLRQINELHKANISGQMPRIQSAYLEARSHFTSKPYLPSTQKKKREMRKITIRRPVAVRAFKWIKARIKKITSGDVRR